jgi:hypothetical protein
MDLFNIIDFKQPIIKKEHILLSVKKEVWRLYCHPSNTLIAQCGTCETLVRIPTALEPFYNIMSLNPNDYKLVGVAEFGHIISEFNGGTATVDNLIIQCKHCNTSLGSDNIKFKKVDTLMLDSDADTEEYSKGRINMNIDNFNDTCIHMLKDKHRLCKNKPIHNSLYCSIHFKT